ncbi:MAG: hypothetical protein NC319_03180 [Butyricicoccus sp.]|nr:hypothetical protein [Butyricicoccus sp.]
MKKKIRYHIEPDGIMTRAAVCFMALSMALRAVWCLLWPGQAAEAGMAVHAVLPLCACALFIVCLLLCGKRALWLSFFPAAVGVAFFILKAASFVWWHRLLCTLLYLLVAALYGAAVFSLSPVKKLLIPLFGLPLLFHIFVEDMIINREIMTAALWLQEGSVLCIMAGLLCVSLALRGEEKPLPKRARRAAEKAAQEQARAADEKAAQEQEN